VNITFQGPSEEELNEWLFDIQQRVMDIAAQVEEVADAFGKDFEKAADAFGEDVENAQRTAEHALEDRVGGDVEELAADLGDAVKEMTDSAVVTWSALAAKSQR